MAEQPANTTIEIFRTIRAQRDDFLHTSVKNRTTPFATMIMNVPGEEILVSETRCAAFRSDAFRYGHPIVVFPKNKALFSHAAEFIANLQFPIRLPGNPRDAFLTHNAGGNRADLHEELRTEALAVDGVPRGLFVQVCGATCANAPGCP